MPEPVGFVSVRNNTIFGACDGRGLDFVEFSEHNTTSQLQYLTAVQARHPDVLLLPGIEVTFFGTWAGVEHPLMTGSGPLAVALATSWWPLSIQ